MTPLDPTKLIEGKVINSINIFDKDKTNIMEFKKQMFEILYDLRNRDSWTR